MSSSGGEAPRRLGRYEIQREIARGAMGVVYLARDPQLDRLVALKTLRDRQDDDPDIVRDLRARFLAEPRTTARLRHPNVVDVYDAGVDPETGLAWLALEYVDGTDLATLFARGMSPRRVAEIVADVAAALDHAHERGVIHRDVKPANILVEKDGRGRLTDFGIARNESGLATRPGSFLGSPAYMAPEQIVGDVVTPATDVHALGAVLYEGLTGRRPFDAPDTTHLVDAILRSSPRPASELEPSLPRSIDRVLDKAFQKDPRRRPATASRLARAALDALAGAGNRPTPRPLAEASTVGASGPRRSRRPAERRVGWPWVAGLSLALLALVLSWAWGWRLRTASAEDAQGVVTAQSRSVQRATGALEGGAGSSDGGLDAEPPSEAGRSVRSGDAPPTASAPRPASARREDGPSGRDGATARAKSTPPASDPSSEPPQRAPAPDAGAAGIPTTPGPQPGAATLVVELFTLQDGSLQVEADDRVVLRRDVREMKRMPQRFRSLKPRRQAVATIEPGAGRRLRFTFEPARGGKSLTAHLECDALSGGSVMVTLDTKARPDALVATLGGVGDAP